MGCGLTIETAPPWFRWRVGGGPVHYSSPPPNLIIEGDALYYYDLGGLIHWIVERQTNTLVARVAALEKERANG